MRVRPSTPAEVVSATRGGRNLIHPYYLGRRIPPEQSHTQRVVKMVDLCVLNAKERLDVGIADHCGVAREMEDLWPSRVAVWVGAPNHPELRLLKTVVVGAAERRRRWRQVGIRKASESESLLKYRKHSDGIETGA
jgi:hypothetical protein